MKKIEDIIRKRLDEEKITTDNIIILKITDEKTEDENIEETCDNIWKEFTLVEKLYFLEKLGYPLI